MFNPVVRFVYRCTDPYLKLFAGMRFVRIGVFDMTPVIAFYLLYLLQELSYNIILRGHITPEFILMLILVLFFRFIYFILFIFMVVTALRLIFQAARISSGNVFVSAVYTISEVAVKPVRNVLKLRESRFDINVFVSLIIIILLRYLVLPRILKLLTMLLGGGY